MTQGSRRGLAAAFFGALAGLGQAPFDLAVLTFAGLCAAVWLYQSTANWRAAAWIGWAFGAGYFALTLHWIVSPFLVNPARHGWMAPFALVFLSGGLALLWAAAFGAARRLSPRAWTLIPCWAAAELVRGYLFTGFPWAMFAQTTVDTIAGQALAWIGPYGVNAVMVLAAVCVMWEGATRLSLRIGQSVLALLGAVALFLPPLAPPEAPLSGEVIRIIQPNAAQRDKWDPERVYEFYNRQLALTASAAPAPPALVIWPETAIPWSLDLAGAALGEIAAAAGAAPVVLGIQRREGARYYNALVVLGAGGAVQAQYDKHHLVPFGEYVPFGDLLGRIGVSGLAARDGQGYSAGPGAQLLELGALGRALPLICYEAVFPRDVNAAPERPDWLIQITNDAWFGPAAGPMQHLAQARMRAIEQGLPLARSANTGVSAMIDPWGRVTASLPMGQAGALDAALPRALPPTLYSRSGDLPLMLLLLLTLGVLSLRAARKAH